MARSIQAFAPPIEIFGPGTSGTDFIENLQPFYHDVDLGQVARLGTGNEISAGHGCVSVTLNRDNPANGNDLFKPVLRWLDASTPNSPTAGSDPIWVADRDADGNPNNDNFEYRSPTVAAIYDPYGTVYGEEGIEVVVAYEYRDEAVDETWRVGVTALHWYDE